MREARSHQEAYHLLPAITVPRHVLVVKEWAAESMSHTAAAPQALTLAATFAIMAGEAATD
jgi:hypothetical protein